MSYVDEVSPQIYASGLPPVKINATTIAGAADLQALISSFWSASKSSAFAYISDPARVCNGPYARQLYSASGGWIIADTPYQLKCPIYINPGQVVNCLVECLYSAATSVTAINGYTGSATCTDLMVIA